MINMKYNTTTATTLGDLIIGDSFKLMPFGKWYTVVDFINPGPDSTFCIASLGDDLVGAFDINHEIYKMKSKNAVSTYTPRGPRLLNVIYQELPQMA